uniref:Ditrans,polycis-polyprenyl diphosphate synthase ((2E,6E)-farnesyldiphosphate specific) n=1 Tax=Parastrongyloides trichosuri TaxID=131310 RepID=A0A0N4ZGC0_PARTI
MMKTTPQIPESIGVLFTDKKQISTALVSSFILKCLETRISRVTFYDPWNILTFYEHEIYSIVEEKLNEIKLNKKDKYDTNEYIKIYVIGSKDVSSLWESTTKELCKNNDKPISKNNIKKQLEKNFVYQIDLLIKIGDTPSLCGYPCWVLSIAEIISVKYFKNKHYISDAEFNNLIMNYTMRDRRQGK